MKFIKDIIGEKRERVRLDGIDPLSAAPVEPPAQDSFPARPPGAESRADTDRAPLSLDRGFLLETDPEPAGGSGPNAHGPAARASAQPEDLRSDDGGTAEAEIQDTGNIWTESAAPEEDAIAAFFAREQEHSLEAQAEDDAPPAGALELPAGNPETGSAGLVEDWSGADEEEQGFSGAQDSSGGADAAESYRIFKRNAAARPGLESASEVVLPTAALTDPADSASSYTPRPEPQVQADPEMAFEPEDEPDAALPPMDETRHCVSRADPGPQSAPAAPIDVPAPSMGRGASRAGRVKTRLLGFSPAQAAGSDPFTRSAEAGAPGYTQFPVGWLAIVKGPGRGAAFTLFSGVTVIGRGEGQTVRLDFGDNSISRDNHAAIAYDPEQKAFYIGHGGKANLVRRNDRPVLSTETLAAGDLIRIGETTLRFVPLCGADFGWDQPQHGDGSHAVYR